MCWWIKRRKAKFSFLVGQIVTQNTHVFCLLWNLYRVLKLSKLCSIYDGLIVVLWVVQRRAMTACLHQDSFQKHHYFFFNSVFHSVIVAVFPTETLFWYLTWHMSLIIWYWSINIFQNLLIFISTEIKICYNLASWSWKTCFFF